MHNKKHIVVLGGGFLGISTAKKLIKKAPQNFTITLIDERDVHIYTPDLYEIATAFNEKITQQCMTRLKDTVAVPISQILHGDRFTFMRDKALKIKPELSSVILKSNGALHFDYLVLGLGSAVNYYGIPGLAAYSYPFKNLTDALAIDCHLDSYFHSLWDKKTKKRIDVVIGGGGATGVELACELKGYLEKLCKKYSFPQSRVHLTVIEGSGKLAGLSENGTEIIKQRCEKFGITVLLNHFIKKVEINEIEVRHGQSTRQIGMDVLIWTGGVMPHPLIRESFGSVAKNGALPVNSFLQSEQYAHIFAGGDCAETKAPMLAQMAFQQGAIIAHNIVAHAAQKKKKPFVPQFKGVIIPLGGCYGLLMKGSFIFKGFFVWLLRRLVDLHYALSILPFFYALRKWVRDTRIFVEND